MRVFCFSTAFAGRPRGPVTATTLACMSRPLIVTSDPLVSAELLRLAAAAGVEVDVAADVVAARAAWLSASVVLVGPDLLVPCAGARLGRRPGVVVLAAELDDASVWMRAVDVGAERVVFLPDGAPWLVQALGEAEATAGRSGLVLAVLGGRGGAGATTFAAALALTGGRRGLRTALVDGDCLGGGVDLVLGAELEPGLRWPDLLATSGRLPSSVADALPRVAGVSVVSWDRGPVAPVTVEVMAEVLDLARRATDLTLVDLPRALDHVAAEVLAAAACTLLVVPAEVRATAAAARVAERASLLCRDVRLVVRGPSPGDVTAPEVAATLGLPLAADLRAEPHLERDLEEGRPPGRRRRPLMVACDALLDDLLGASVARRAA